MLSILKTGAIIVKEWADPHQGLPITPALSKSGPDCIGVDALGFVPFDRIGGEHLFNLPPDRYERRSTLVTTNLSFGEWVEVFGDEKLATALLDRRTHHAHILTTRGESYRSPRMRRRSGGEETTLKTDIEYSETTV